MQMTRRNMMGLLATGSVGIVVSGLSTGCTSSVDNQSGLLGGLLDQTYPFRLPDLGYAYEALEPAIDAQTMRIHHGRHHQGYVDKLNAVLEAHPSLQAETLGALLRNLDGLPESARTAVQNNGGGHFNHALFWQLLSPNGGGEPTGMLGQALIQTFGSFSGFKAQFEQAATSLFGSGWAWLVADNQRNLRIVQTSQQNTPLADGLTPLLALDVWEHAYYLQYQNRRGEYVTSFWDIVNWQQCEASFTSI